MKNIFLFSFLIFSAVLAIGCSTTNITFKQPDEQPEKIETINPNQDLLDKKKSKLFDKSSIQKHQEEEIEKDVFLEDSKKEEGIVEVLEYGRFKIEKHSDGRTTIVGGKFEPRNIKEKFFNQEAFSNTEHVILVNYTDKTLEYYKKGKPISGYAVVTPDASYLPVGKNEVLGRVRQIIKDPSWCPTANIRKKYPDLPKGCIPPRHLENAMGAFKFMISWREVRGWEAVRLHGANGYPQNFLDEETSGCVRLQDKAITELVNKLGNDAVKEGISIVVFRESFKVNKN